jgi:hypothetical protein
VGHRLAALIHHCKASARLWGRMEAKSPHSAVPQGGLRLWTCYLSSCAPITSKYTCKVDSIRVVLSRSVVFDQEVVARDGMQRPKDDQLELPQKPQPQQQQYHRHRKPPILSPPESSSARSYHLSVSALNVAPAYSAARASLPEQPLLSLDHTRADL